MMIIIIMMLMIVLVVGDNDNVKVFFPLQKYLSTSGFLPRRLCGRPDKSYLQDCCTPVLGWIKFSFIDSF